jgi:DNA adenine methylase
MPARFEAYHEPFVGGGALFFEMCRLQRLSGGAHLSDINTRLITLYQVIRDHTDALIAELRDLAGRTFREAYMEARREFNGPPSPPSLRTAALFLYLNRLCFNGLFRVNRRGEFNVPYGRYKDPDVVREPALRAAARALAGAGLHCQDFERAMSMAERGDLVYLDPPYLPLSPTSSFTAYTGPFGLEQQQRLAEECQVLHARGVRFMLSNCAHPRILELYRHRDFHVHRVQARRAINAVASGRGKIDEIIVRNFQE